MLRESIVREKVEELWESYFANKFTVSLHYEVFPLIYYLMAIYTIQSSNSEVKFFLLIILM